jgi:hypothetical protein
MTHNVTRHQDSSTNLYEQDYYGWLKQTALSLRQRAFEQLDMEHLIEELEDMGRSEKRAIESNLRVVLLHLLKWTYSGSHANERHKSRGDTAVRPPICTTLDRELLYQPQQRCGSWRGSIAEHRIRIRKALQDSPSLKNYLPDIFAETYQDAIKIASQETGLAPEIFPTSCEWTLQQICDETWLPN